MYTRDASDKDALLRRGFEVALGLYENCIVSKVSDVYLRDKLYDATIDGLLAAVRTYKAGIGHFEGYLYFVVKRKWSQQSRCARWQRRILSMSYRWRPNQEKRPRELTDSLTKSFAGFDDVDAREFIESQLLLLNPRQAIAVKMRMASATQKEIGKALGVRVQRADQILARSYTVLRGEMEPM